MKSGYWAIDIVLFNVASDNPDSFYDYNCLLLSNRTLPAGYMEIGESSAEGAIRETWEEATAEVEILSPFAQLDIPRIGQVW